MKLADESCPFICKYYTPIECDLRFKQHIIMEFYQNKSIEYYITFCGPMLSLATKFYLLYQICLGMRYYKSKGLVHNMISP
jgi:serine/threonine protein kinase